MNTKDDYQVDGASGTRWLQSQLSAIFDRVATPGDWKAPIRATVNTHDLGDILNAYILDDFFVETAISDAVIHFTGTAPVIVPAIQPGRWTVDAVGYRMGPCGP